MDSFADVEFLVKFKASIHESGGKNHNFNLIKKSTHITANRL